MYVCIACNENIFLIRHLYIVRFLSFNGNLLGVSFAADLALSFLSFNLNNIIEKQNKKIVKIIHICKDELERKVFARKNILISGRILSFFLLSTVLFPKFSP